MFYGLNNFIVSLNYKNTLIKAFFKDLSPNFKVSFLEETKPLGTAGVLYKLKNKNKKYIISNCDVVFDIDYNYLINLILDLILRFQNTNLNIFLQILQNQSFALNIISHF